MGMMKVIVMRRMKATIMKTTKMKVVIAKLSKQNSRCRKRLSKKRCWNSNEN